MGVCDVEVDDLIRRDFASAIGTVGVLLQRCDEDAANGEGVFLRRLYFAEDKLVASFTVGEVFVLLFHKLTPLFCIVDI